jgi:hypothetical protein
VFAYDEVVEVSRHPQTFGSHPSVFVHDPEDGAGGASELLINQDPPRHTKLRKLVNRGFTPRQVSALEPHVRAIVRRLLDAAAAKRELDLVTDVAVKLPLQVIAELVSIPTNGPRSLPIPACCPARSRSSSNDSRRSRPQDRRSGCAPTSSTASSRCRSGCNARGAESAHRPEAATREALAQGLDVGARDRVAVARDEILHRQAAGSLVEHAA